MEGFFDLPTGFYRSLNMLSNGLRNFVFILLGHLYEGVELVEVDP